MPRKMSNILDELEAIRLEEAREARDAKWTTVKGGLEYMCDTDEGTWRLTRKDADELYQLTLATCHANGSATPYFEGYYRTLSSASEYVFPRTF